MADIAALVGVHKTTLESRIKDDPELSMAIERGRAEGRLAILTKQFQIAFDDGNRDQAMMVKHLGICYAGQGKTDNENKGKLTLADIANEIAERRQSRLHDGSGRHGFEPEGSTIDAEWSEAE